MDRRSPAAIGASDALALAPTIEQVRTQFDQVGGHVVGAVRRECSRSASGHHFL